ncbi:transcription factor-like protein 24 [Elsinoe australis]|uniref:Transcription factor-like protein 24 n=1 Tax=Elsinoe australis TaxID=40998 RepID=A0A4U7AUP0_9PEZI|nr:transcription factor-like protein 24 [Elsinoe australis]
MAEAQLPGNMLKRKRSSPSISSASAPPPPPKTPKTTNAVQINYLARQSPQDLPLLSKTETIPNILDVLSSYSSVLDRHESLASNLGARPLGPILIKRFERCFDAPPDIIASHSHAKDTSETPQVTWLEVIQFAQSHPGQFTLSTFSEGRRVCQFYYPQKQVRVQVTEEDFLFIKSGRCQDLIPPLPIWEDEEKEVGTCEILEKQLRELTNAADTVAARTRQLSHRLKGRRMAIMERRAGEKQANVADIDTHDSVHDQPSPDNPAYRNSGVGFTAVNGASSGSSAAVNGIEPPAPTAPVSVRHELLKHFQSLSQNQTSDSRRQSVAAASPKAPQPPVMHGNPHHEPEPMPAHVPSSRPDPLSYYLASTEPPPPVVTAAARLTPAHGPKHNFSRPLAPGQEITQPFRNLCQAHMESLPRGSRVMPPCDRCRRLKMDCLKNLTSCQGCTKKHARCHWKEVGRDEVEGLEGFGLEGASGGTGSAGDAAGMTGSDRDYESEDDGGGALEDLEALGREDESEHERPGVKSVERRAWENEMGGRTGDDRGQVIATAGGNSVIEAQDRARDVFRGGLPYSTPATGNTSFREAPVEHPRLSTSGGGSSPKSGPPSVTAVPASSTTEAARPSTASDRAQESRTLPFPPFEPPQQRHHHDLARTQEQSHPDPVSSNHGTFRPSSAFTSVNNATSSGRSTPVSVSNKMDIDRPTNGFHPPPQAHHRRESPTQHAEQAREEQRKLASERWAADKARNEADAKEREQESARTKEADAAREKEREAREREAERERTERAVSPFSATIGRPKSAAGQGQEGGEAKRGFLEGVGGGSGVSVGGGGGAGGSSGWRGM